MARRRSKNTTAAPAPDSDGLAMDALGRPLESPLIKEHDEADANDPAILERQAKAEKRRQASDNRVIQEMMATREGRDWFYRLLSVCHIYDAGTDLGTEHRPSDPFKTYFLNGERNIGHRLLADVQRAAPSAYMQMLAEAKRESDYAN